MVDGNGLLANRSRSLLLFGWADLRYLSFIHTLLLSIGMGHWAWELIILRLSSVITYPLHATVHYLVVICLCSVEEKVFSENRIKTVCIFLKQTSNIRSLQKLTHPHTNTHTHQKVLKQVHRITYLVSRIYNGRFNHQVLIELFTSHHGVFFDTIASMPLCRYVPSCVLR